MRFEATQGLNAVKTAQFVKARANYEAVRNGDDPVTSQPIYVDCDVNGTAFRMNAGKEAAKAFDEGLKLAEKNGETHTFVVDFYNQVHEDVPLADAFTINLQQSLDARVHYIEYQTMKEQIALAQTVEDVRRVPMDFSINS